MNRLLAALAAACALACSPAPAPVAVELELEPPSSYPALVLVPPAVAVEPERASLELPDRCDTLLAVERDGRRRLTKRRPAWLASPSAAAAQRAWVRGVIEIVGDELGVDALAVELAVRKAISESSANPAALHLLDPDVEANAAAAHVGIEATADRWRAARTPIYEDRRGEMVEVGTISAWALGRGLYGHATGYVVSQRWSTAAPPWSLCDPVVATVVLFWSARAGQERCRDRSLRSAYRWISAGRCSPRSAERERAWDRMARGSVRGLRLGRIPADAEVSFGRRWDQESADREILLARLHRRVAEELGPPPH